MIRRPPRSTLFPSTPLSRSATPARNAKPSQPADSRYKEWSFGELPELMEIGRGGQTLIGFPALIDHGDAVGIEVFDEPEVAAARHRVGLRDRKSTRLNSSHLVISYAVF